MKELQMIGVCGLLIFQRLGVLTEGVAVFAKGTEGWRISFRSNTPSLHYPFFQDIQEGLEGGSMSRTVLEIRLGQFFDVGVRGSVPIGN